MMRLRSIRYYFIFQLLWTCLLYGQEGRIDLGGAWKFKPQDSTNYYQANVPGSVYVDWQANGFVESLYSPEAEAELAWMENSSWEYVREFDADSLLLSKELIRLVCEGIDTYADLYLNDRWIGTTSNMFLKYEFDCKPYLQSGINRLKIVLLSPVAMVERDTEKKFIYPADNDRHVRKTSAYTRKAAYQYGWDFAPRLAAGGIWKDIYLMGADEASIEHVIVEPILKDSTQGDFLLTVNLRRPVSDLVVIEVAEVNGFSEKIKAEIFAKQPQYIFEIKIPISNPRMWNTWERGVPFRYRFKISIQSKMGSSTYSVETGFSAIKFESQHDSIGTSFQFLENGKPLFIRGANWVPLSMFPGIVTDSVYDAYFETARKLNINMLRVWGGGIYERDYFYECADKYGILIWQDFMFGGTLYPGNTAFVEEVKREVAYQVQRLSQHPCIALWCGNNEIDVAIKNWGWQQTYNYDSITWLKLCSDYKSLFEIAIDSIVKHNVAGAAYVHTSPLSNWGKAEDFLHFDNHYWGVWHGELPLSSYYEKVPRFCSEYGMQSFPDAALIPDFLNKSSSWQSERVKPLQRSYKGNKLLNRYIEDYYPQAASLPDWVYLSQLVQAEAYYHAVAAHRTSKPFCMGTVFWQFNDCYPSASWSVLNYNHSSKAAAYMIKQVFKPVQAFAQIARDSLCITVVNDFLTASRNDLVVRLVSLNGEVLFQKIISVEIGANSKKNVFGESLSKICGNVSRDNLYIQYSFGKAKSDLPFVLMLSDMRKAKLPRPTLEAEVSTVANREVITIKSETFAKSVHIWIDGDAQATFSNNYFDLSQNNYEHHVVVNSKFKGQELKQRIRLKSLYEATLGGK